MKLLNLSKLFVAVLSFGFGAVLSAGVFHALTLYSEKVANEYEYKTLDVYAARTYLTILESTEKFTQFTTEQFVSCALKDTYLRVERNIESLKKSEVSLVAAKFRERSFDSLTETQKATEDYWQKFGKIDCEDIGWKN